MYFSFITIGKQLQPWLQIDWPKIQLSGTSFFIPPWQLSVASSQWEWPPDLLLCALVAALCQYSLHHSGTHRQPRSVHRPGWSPWTISKQITFPAATNLQLPDRTFLLQDDNTAGLEKYLILLSLLQFILRYNSSNWSRSRFLDTSIF